MFAGAALAQGGDGIMIGSGNVKAKVMGEHRTRHEITTPSTFGVDRTTSVTWMRTRFGVDVSMPEGHNFMFQLQDIRDFGSEPTAAANTNDTLDVLQAYYSNMNFLGEGIEMRLGRQKFDIGDQRLFSTNEWSQTSRAWDGIHLAKNFNNSRLGGFFLVIDDDTPGNFASDQRYNIGVTFDYNGIADHMVQFFALHDIAGGGQYTGGVDGDTTTLSLRIKGMQMENKLGYSVEGVWQAGTVEAAGGDADISAWAIFANINYTHGMEGGSSVKIGAGLDMTSGDDDATDDEMGTFMAPYPQTHDYYGYADVVGPSNLTDIYVNVMYNSGKSWMLEAAGHFFSRTEEDDAMYANGGGVAFAAAAGAADDIGMELDLLFTYKCCEYANMQIGWSHFFAGDFIDDVAAAGADDDIDFLYATLNLKF